MKEKYIVLSKLIEVNLHNCYRKRKDLEELKIKKDIDCNDTIPEYVDKITCSSGEVYTNSLILCSNEFGISLIIPMELTPQNLKDYIID